MRISSVTACSSVVGLCILGTLAACVGDDSSAPAATTVQDGGGGADTSSPGSDSGGGIDSSTADTGAEAGLPPSTGTHKWVKSYSMLYSGSTVATFGEDAFTAGLGVSTLDIDGISLPTGTTAVMAKLGTATGQATWAKSFAGTGGTLNLRASAVAANAGGAYMTGFFDTTNMAIGTDTLARTAGRAGFVASLKPADGATNWGRSIQTTSGGTGFSCNAITATPNGVAVGCTSDQTTIKVGTSLASTNYSSVAAGGMSDIVVVMFDTTGAVTWVNFFTGASNDTLAGLATDPSGDVILLANVASASLADKLTSLNIAKPGNAGTAVPYLARLGAANGQVTWSKFLGAGGANASAIAVSADGKSIAVAGTVTGTNDFGIGALAPVGAGNSGDAFVVVLDAANRTPLWQSQVGGSGTSGSEDGRGVAFDSHNQLVLVGLNRSTDTKVGLTPITSPPQNVSTGWGSFAVKYDPAGKVLWTKGFASQNVSDAIGMESVAFTAAGEVRAAGGLQGTAPLDGTNNKTADVSYQSVVWGWNP